MINFIRFLGVNAVCNMEKYGTKGLFYTTGVIVCYTAVFYVVTQRSFPCGEERCVTTLKTAVWQTTGVTERS